MSTPFSSQDQLFNGVMCFEDFYRLYQENPGVYKYQDQIDEIYEKNTNTLTFLYEDLFVFDPKAAKMLLNDPETLLWDAIEAFKNVLKFKGSKLEHNSYHIQVRTLTNNSKLISDFKDLNSNKISHLIFCRGIVSAISQVKSLLLKGSFECALCGSAFEVIQLTSRIKWPNFCINQQCKAKTQSDFRLIEKESKYIDCQEIFLEEINNDLHLNRSSIMLKARLIGSLVNSINLGDRIQITGILKTEGRDNIKKNQPSKFNFRIEINNIHRFEKIRRSIPSKNFINKIENLSQEDDVLQKVANSIFRNLPYNLDLKKACTLSLFGSNEGQIHILLIGDEGTGKSTILRTISEIFPWSFYTFGKDSEISLIPNISKNEIDRQLYIWSGALNYGKDGHTLIDNLDEIVNNEKGKLQQLIEEGKLLIKKGSFQSHQTINTSIIAAIQPSNGLYDRYISFRDNFKKDMSLLDKFDIITFFDDISDQEKNLKEVDTIMDVNQEDLLSKEFLVKYIEYAQSNFRPKFRKDAQEELIESLNRIKQDCSTENRKITKRHITTIKKLCEAHAKIHLRNEVLIKDVKSIEMLFKRYLKNLGFDSHKTKIDMDRIFVRQSRSNLNRLESLMNMLKEIFEENNWKALERSSIVKVLELNEDLDKKFIESALEELVEEGSLYHYPDSDKIQLRDPNFLKNI